MLTPVSSKLEVVSWIVERSLNNWCFSTIFQIMTQRRWWNATLTSSMTCTDSGVYSTWYRLRNFRVILKQFDFLQVTRTRKVTCVNCGFFLFEFSKSNPHKKLSEGREFLGNSWHQLNYPQKCPPIIRTNGTKDKRHFTTKNDNLCSNVTLTKLLFKPQEENSKSFICHILLTFNKLLLLNPDKITDRFLPGIFLLKCY